MENDLLKILLDRLSLRFGNAAEAAVEKKMKSNKKTLASRQRKWCYLATAGGRFAAAIFHGEECILHKTMHRYTGKTISLFFFLSQF